MSLSKLSFLSSCFCLCLTCSLFAQSGSKNVPPAMQNQQQKPNSSTNSNIPIEEAPKFQGSITEIKTKGKINTLVINVEGKTQEVILTPKIKFGLETPSDLTILKEGAYVETKVNQPNQRSLVALDVKVYSDLKAKPPTGQISPAPAVAGESKNNLLISGKIISFSDKSAFEGYQDLVVQAGSQKATIQIPQKGMTVHQVDTDPTKLKVGDKVELDGTMLKNGKLIVTQIRGSVSK